MALSEEDWVEVSRKAHELGGSHGLNAVHFAVRMAEKALANGDPKEHEFWKAAEASLTPR